MYNLEINPMFSKNYNYQLIINKYNSRKNKITTFLKNDLLKSKQQLLLLNEKCLIINKTMNRINEQISKLKSNKTKHNINPDISFSDEPTFSFKHIEPILFKNLNNFNNLNNLGKNVKGKCLKFELDFITKTEINSLLLKSKSKKLEEIISSSVKNKPFKKIINVIKGEIYNLTLNFEKKKAKIVELRKAKIEYYKNLDLQIYDNINNTISDDNLSSLQKSFFFDNIDVYRLIRECNLIIKELNEKNIDLQIIIDKMKYYNSEKVRHLLSSIRSKKTKKKHKMFNNSKNKSSNISIYINNELKYNSFIFNLNNIFINQLEQSLKMNTDNFERCHKKIIYLENKIDIIEKCLDFKIVNTILLNTCKNYQKKLDTIGLNEYKKMKYDY